jgi:hypothetical protein
MTALTFDTLKYANALKKAGVSQEQAEAQAGALSEVLEINLKELATKGDLRELQTEAKGEITQLRGEIAEVRGKMSTLQWMVGVIVAGVIALVLKAFLHV